MDRSFPSCATEHVHQQRQNGCFRDGIQRSNRVWICCCSLMKSWLIMVFYTKFALVWSDGWWVSFTRPWAVFTRLGPPDEWLVRTLSAHHHLSVIPHLEACWVSYRYRAFCGTWLMHWHLPTMNINYHEWLQLVSSDSSSMLWATRIRNGWAVNPTPGSLWASLIDQSPSVDSQCPGCLRPAVVTLRLLCATVEFHDVTNTSRLETLLFCAPDR